MNVHVSVLQEEEVKIRLESEIIQVEGTVSGDYIPVPSTAEVGQTIVVKAVDENGKPTAWEAVDMPSGGGEEALPMLYHGTIEEAITNAEFTEIDGIPISLSEVKVRTCFKSSEAAWCDIVIVTSAVNPDNDTIEVGTGGTYTTAEKLYVSSVDAKISDGNFELSGIKPVVFTAYYNLSYNISGASYVKSIPNITFSSTPELQEKNACNGKINKIRITGSFSKLEVIIWGR